MKYLKFFENINSTDIDDVLIQHIEDGSCYKMNGTSDLVVYRFSSKRQCDSAEKRLKSFDIDFWSYNKDIIIVNKDILDYLNNTFKNIKLFRNKKPNKYIFGVNVSGIDDPVLMINTNPSKYPGIKKYKGDTYLYLDNRISKKLDTFDLSENMKSYIIESYCNTFLKLYLFINKYDLEPIEDYNLKYDIIMDWCNTEDNPLMPYLSSY